MPIESCRLFTINSNALAVSNILLTRPQGQADALIAAITAAGGHAWHYPVMAIAALDASTEPSLWQQCKQQIMALDQFQQVIFISGNAVTYGVDWINQYWPQLPVGTHWYGIGSSTIKQLQQLGIPVVSGLGEALANTAMNSETLLQHNNLQQLAGQKVLIIRGVGGRDYLQQQLLQRGASVHYAQCYQRNIVDRPQGEVAQLIEQQAIDTLCVNSGESLQNLCALAGSEQLPLLQKKCIVVPGERVAVMARQAGFESILVADNASDKAVLAVLAKIQPN